MGLNRTFGRGQEGRVLMRLSGLSKRFQEGGRTRGVLRAAEAQSARGEFVTILGKSGSDKCPLSNPVNGIDCWAGSSCQLGIGRPGNKSESDHER